MRSRETVKITNNFDGRRKKDELDGKPADSSRGISGYFRSNGMPGITVAKINKKNLTVICGIVALAQLITLYLGHFLSSLFCRYRSVPDEKLLGQIISMVIFMILGIRLMVKAIRNEHVEEHLEHHLGIRRFVRMACISGIYTLLTGIAFGFLETNVLMILIMIVVCTVAFVIGGIYTGYRVGYEAKTKVYIVGALLLWVAGLDVLFGRIL